MAIDEPLIVDDEMMGRPDMRTEEEMERRPGDAAGSALILTGLALMVITTWWTILGVGWGILGAFAYHPTFQVLGVALFGLGIQTLQPTSHARTKAQGLTRHQILILCIGLPSLAIGTGSIVVSKISANGLHLKSLHAILGLISILWLLFQGFLGGGSVWFGGALFGGGTKAKGVWKYHRVSGYLLFLLFMVVIWLGVMFTTLFPSNTTVATRILVFNIAPVAVLAGIYSRARLPKMPIFS